MNVANCSELVTVILRASGERTVDVSRKLICEQGVSESCINVINEAPFSKALRRSYEIGIDSKRKWTLCVDADVLLRKNCIRDLLAFADKVGDSCCEIQGGVLDKFFGGARGGGIHLYRTKHLSKALSLIPREGEDIRPEARTLAEMAKIGFPSKQIYYVVGLHDFEQNYCDIYRKTYVYAQKHQKYTGAFISRWKKEKKSDLDYKIALNGFVDGILSERPAAIDIRCKEYIFDYKKFGVAEKEVINPDDWSDDRIEAIVLDWVESDFYPKVAPLWSNTYSLSPSGSSPILLMCKRLYKYNSFLRFISLATGYTLRSAGNFLIEK